MYRVLLTNEFERWLNSQQAKTQVILKARLDLLSLNHWGDHKRFDGLIELRWKNGNRVYSFMWKERLVVVLFGGNKNGQSKDIKKAKKIREEILAGSRTVYE